MPKQQKPGEKERIDVHLTGPWHSVCFDAAHSESRTDMNETQPTTAYAFAYSQSTGQAAPCPPPGLQSSSPGGLYSGTSLIHSLEYFPWLHTAQLPWSFFKT